MRIASFLAAAGLALVLVVTSGCGTMTPELTTTGRSAGQDYYKNMRIYDNNTRGAWDDANRIFLQDRNSRLTPYPVP